MAKKIDRTDLAAEHIKELSKIIEELEKDNKNCRRALDMLAFSSSVFVSRAQKKYKNLTIDEIMNKERAWRKFIIMAKETLNQGIPDHLDDE